MPGSIPASCTPAATSSSTEPVRRKSQIPAQFLLVNAITVKWIFVYELTKEERAAAVATITGMMEAKRLIHNVALTLPLERIVQAHEAVEQGKAAGNVVLTME